MNKAEVINYLHKNLNFSKDSINKLEIYEKMLLDYNQRYNLIAKSTEINIWDRHILDSAQIVQYLPSGTKGISDFGSGAGFPGLIIAIFDANCKFHVKLYEKSPIKRKFLSEVSSKLALNVEILGNVYADNIKSDVIVCRAFKKLKEILSISREKIKNRHKLIILKGKNAQIEINNVSLKSNYRYRLVKSITNKDSKIIIIDAGKN